MLSRHLFLLQFVHSLVREDFKKNMPRFNNSQRKHFLEDIHIYS